MNKRLMVALGLGVSAGVALPGLCGFFGGHAWVDAQCLSAFGSLNNGVCLNQPSGGVPSGGTPWVGVGPTDNGGPGISSGPLFPGQTFNVPLGQ